MTLCLICFETETEEKLCTTCREKSNKLERVKIKTTRRLSYPEIRLIIRQGKEKDYD